MSAMKVSSLEVEYGRGKNAFKAVRGVDFTLEPGLMLGLVGESGSGKSTVARAVSGLVASTAGTITRGEGARKHGVQMVFQDPFSSLNPRMTVDAMFREALGLVGSTRSPEDLASLVHLEPSIISRYPHELSGGQRQRVAIGRALAVDPQVLVLDEVTAALDVSIQAQILDTLSELQQELGFAGLFISHDLAVVRQMCQGVAVMYLGEFVERGRSEELFDAPQHEYTRKLLAAVPGATQWEE
jgi:peptide/nickel transport system ATP-binding protein